jgi:hypothetical protein
MDKGEVTEYENHSLGMQQMIEYKLNPERMGLYERANLARDAINDPESNRLDGLAHVMHSINDCKPTPPLTTDCAEQGERKRALMIEQYTDGAAPIQSPRFRTSTTTS